MKDNDPGRSTRTMPHYDPGMFSDVKSVDDFAAVLQVPKESIALIIPRDKKCNTKTISSVPSKVLLVITDIVPSILYHGIHY